MTSDNLNDGLRPVPGKPMTFATNEQAIVCGLPGNPVASYLMFHLFVLRCAQCLSGQTVGPRFVSLPLAADYRRRRADREEFRPCRLSASGHVEDVDYHGSAHLQSLVGTHGFFVVPAGVETLAAGQQVDYIGQAGGFA